MKVKKMIEEINFHDSNVIELLHINDIVKLKIDLCMWKQKGYKEDAVELKEIVLVFNAVTNYIWDAEKSEVDINYDTILEMSYDGGVLKIILEDDEISIIKFKCNTVEIT